MRILTIIKYAVLGYISAFAITLIMCIVLSIVTDFGEFMTWRQQLAMMLSASLSSALWGLLAFVPLVLINVSGKTRFKKLKSIKDHFDIDYPDKP